MKALDIILLIFIGIWILLALRSMFRCVQKKDYSKKNCSQCGNTGGCQSCQRCKTL